jgi:hypothetical protein
LFIESRPATLSFRLLVPQCVESVADVHDLGVTPTQLGIDTQGVACDLVQSQPTSDPRTVMAMTSLAALSSVSPLVAVGMLASASRLASMPHLGSMTVLADLIRVLCEQISHPFPRLHP